MSLLIPISEFLVREHCYRPITGKTLFIGRQTCAFTPETHKRLLDRHGVRNACSGPVEYDNQTRYSEGKGWITDRYFMKALGAEEFQALDVTDYEGAEIVHDLGYPIGDEYARTFDFIYNGGCFDNMFNPGVAMMSLSKILKPGGRMLCMESASSFVSLPYLIFSPGWFFDYFVINKYADCKVYIAAYLDGYKLWHGPWDFSYVNMPANPVGGPPETNEQARLLVITIAEKGPDSTDDRQPVQSVYRIGDMNKAYDEHQAKLLAHPRPIITDGRTLNRPFTDYLVPVGQLGKDLV
jgi:SAM-dependent methyltransferase